MKLFLGAKEGISLWIYCLQIDLDDPETAEKHPGLKTLPFRECVLEPGQMLYIPPRHWHYVRSLDVSFSVTFWWQ